MLVKPPSKVPLKHYILAVEACWCCPYLETAWLCEGTQYTVHLWNGCSAVRRCMTAALGGLASFILATAWEAGKQKPGWRMRAQIFFFLSEMSSYVPIPGRRRPPARCDKPQAHALHCTGNAVGGLPKLMGLMTVIALGNLSFSLPCTFSPCGALYTYLQVHIWNAPASQAWFR